MNKKVLIVGGGIGGMCAAIGLRRNNVTLEMVELNPNWAAAPG